MTGEFDPGADLNGKCVNQIDAMLADPDIGKNFKKGSLVPDNVRKGGKWQDKLKTMPPQN